MKLLTILGTRPEIIRLCRVIEKLDGLCEQVIVHTGQNYDRNLNELFFEELGVRAPDHFLGARGSFGEQMGTIIVGMEKLLGEVKPDKFLVLGDTNSSLGAIAVKRAGGIPVYHMEAGNRCYDDRVPEEVNRRIIDHSSDVLLPYTERSRQNLLREGIAGERIFVTGNPINEVIRHYEPKIAASTILSTLGVATGRYFLVTMHRAENVDIPERLKGFTEAFARLSADYGLPVIVSTHPRTRARMASFGVSGGDGVRFLDPFGFFDFIALESNAFCVLSDSGTVQEECAILGVPNVTIRDITERPETLECGSNVLSGGDVETIMSCVKAVTKLRGGWTAPTEYLAENVSETVARIVTGYRHEKR